MILKFETGAIDIDFSFAEKILKKIAKKVLKQGLPKGIDLINLNIPANPASDEIKIVNLGERMYTPIIKTRFDPEVNPIIGLVENPLMKILKIPMDIVLKENLTTLTPLKLDFTGDIDLLKKWIKL